jgi:hypothetical protein
MRLQPMALAIGRLLEIRLGRNFLLSLIGETEIYRIPIPAPLVITLAQPREIPWKDVPGPP